MSRNCRVLKICVKGDAPWFVLGGLYLLLDLDAYLTIRQIIMALAVECIFFSYTRDLSHKPFPPLQISSETESEGEENRKKVCYSNLTKDEMIPSLFGRRRRRK